MAAPVTESDAVLRVLIAEDNDSDRLILKTILTKSGHEVLLAKDGQEAIEQFLEHSPDIVLLDAMMPRVDGLTAARTISQLAGENLVPIVFLTSLKDATSLADCLAAGGHDFLSKPYNQIILQAKVRAFGNMRRLHETVQAQRDEISLYNDRLVHEQEMAKQVFDNILNPGCIDVSNIKYLLSPMAVFNGDLILAARRPAGGGMCVFLGDFTGHGLPAAIGALPVSEIFYGMTRKGFSAQDVLLEINKKLKSILPVGVFCCACMVDLSFRKGAAEVWVGGLPDVVIYRPNTKTIETVPSRHLPLGVVDNNSFAVTTETVRMDVGDRFLFWSDGIIEATNDNDEMFGEERVLNVIREADAPEAVFKDIIAAVEQYTGKSEQDDDYTMVEVTMVPEEELVFSDRHPAATQVSGGPRDWRLSYELRPQTLREFNPLPLVTHLLMEVPGLRAHSGKLYTILAELYSNALEHGILGLSSDLKASAEGFARYYALRTERLADLETGYVRFTLDHVPQAEGGLLTMEIEDSGPGFDYQAKQASRPDQSGYCGRGMPLIKTLCESVRYRGAGNIVEVVFQWGGDV